MIEHQSALCCPLSGCLPGQGPVSRPDLIRCGKCQFASACLEFVSFILRGFHQKVEEEKNE